MAIYVIRKASLNRNSDLKTICDTFCLLNDEKAIVCLFSKLCCTKHINNLCALWARYNLIYQSNLKHKDLYRLHQINEQTKVDIEHMPYIHVVSMYNFNGFFYPKQP